ncbi:ectonucleoside triphosphate diphosphohydrolase 2-like protein, partial [Dinothrombium tinctorium]
MRRLYFGLSSICVVCLIVVIVVYSSTGGNFPFDYGIVIDAGSARSEVSLFKWLGDHTNRTGVVFEVTDCETHEGIDDNEDNVKPTINHLVKCVKTISQFIDLDKKSVTPLYFGATAGMRILQVGKPSLAEFIINSIKKAFAKLKVNGKVISARDIRIIPGKEEGVFSWISVNYLLKNIAPLAGGEMRNRTVGILDMGGASAQIAYEVSNTTARTAEEEDVVLFGTEYRVLADSNLCFGKDEALKRYLVTLIQSHSSSDSIITDPCLQEDAQRTIHGSELSKSACLHSSSPGIKLFSHDIAYLFKGSAKRRECSKAIEKVVDVEECRKTFKYCIKVRSNPPPRDMLFYAISNYYFATSNSFPSAHNVSAKEFQANIQLWCSRKWADIVDNVKYPLRFVIDYCFLLNYIYVTLTKVYKFDELLFENIIFQKRVDGQSISWSLGYMINSTNGLPPLEPYPPLIPKGPFIL